MLKNSARYGIDTCMMSREEYIEYWKYTSIFRCSEITPESFFVRIEDDTLFENYRFDSPLEAIIFFRYRNVPDMLIESRGFFDMSVYSIREQLQESGCYLRSSGLELLDLLDSVVTSGVADSASIIKFKELYNRTSRFAFDRSHAVRQWIHIMGYVEEFIRSNSLRKSFDIARSFRLKEFIELELLLKENEFSTSCEHHLKLASDFIEWSGDLYLQNTGNYADSS